MPKVLDIFEYTDKYWKYYFSIIMGGFVRFPEVTFIDNPKYSYIVSHS